MIAQGAEAKLIKRGKVLVKDRINKNYRHKKIDSVLRKRRTRSEAKIISKVSLVIDVPKIRKIQDTKIEMDFISGRRLSDFLDEMSEKKSLNVCKIIGKSIAKIHDIDIIHGDLTTSNMIFKDKNKKVYFIDFGLSFHSHRIEDKAVDLHLLRQAFESKHFKRWGKYFRAVISSYKKSNHAKDVLKQLEKVEMRGRYKAKKRKDKKRKTKK